MMRIFISFTIMTLMMCTITSCAGNSAQKQSSSSNDVSGVTEEPNWTYYQKTDEMTDKTMYFAKCFSTNTVDFDFPYNGGSTLDLLVRNMDGTNEVLVHLSKGIINFSVGSLSSMRVRFDDAKAETYSYNSSDDANLDFAFLDKPRDFINKLKKAKIVKIEVPVANESRTVFNFSVDGFKWEH